MKCKWAQWTVVCGEETNIWDTGCGKDFVLNEGTLEENKFKFCPYCGGEIEEQK
jgi:rRNA maturation endonuclease Nob1